MITTPTADRDLIRSQNRGSRVYGIKGESYPSVTAIVQAGEPKPALIGWGMKATATAAVEQYDLVGKLIKQDGPSAAIAHLKGAPYRQRDAAGELGSKLHEVAEHELVMGTPYPDPGSDAARQLLDHFRDFVKVMRATWLAVEAIVYNEDYDYAGTLDAIAELDPGESDLDGLARIPLLVDWKSGSGVYGSYALQLAAYSRATHLVGPQGHVPMSDLGIDRERAVVVHITPQGWKLVEVDIGDHVFEAFLTCRDMAVWAKETSDEVIGRTLASGRANGGKGVKLGQRKVDKPDAPTPDTIKDFGARRRIAPPTLSK